MIHKLNNLLKTSPLLKQIQFNASKKYGKMKSYNPAYD